MRKCGSFVAGGVQAELWFGGSGMAPLAIAGADSAGCSPLPKTTRKAGKRLRRMTPTRLVDLLMVVSKLGGMVPLLLPYKSRCADRNPTM